MSTRSGDAAQTDAPLSHATTTTGAPANVLILGGTQDARALAALLADDASLAVTSSLAGRTAAPLVPRGNVRSGGFGGVDGLVAYLECERVAAVVDATHPFAARMSANAVRACARAGVPLLVLERPPWTPRDGDRFVDVPDVATAARVARDRARRIFLTVGRGELAPFAAVRDRYFLVRSIEAPAPELVPPDCDVVLARGPFAYEDELRLLQDYRIDCVVAKNSGGDATAAKLDAARTLGIDVVMIARPPRTVGGDPTVAAVATTETIAGVARWIAATLDYDARNGRA